MNRLKEWFKQFSGIKRLGFKEVKLLLNQARITDNEQQRNEIYNKVTLGTMYIIYDYIINSKLYLSVNQDFDMDDLISSFTRYWISLLHSEDFEMFDSFDQVIDNFQLYHKSLIGFSNDGKSIPLDRASKSQKRLYNISEIRNIFKVYNETVKEKGNCSVEDIKKAKINIEYENDELLEQLIEAFDYLCQNDWVIKRNEKGILSSEDYHIIIAMLRNKRSKTVSIFEHNIEEETVEIDDQLEKVFKEQIAEDIVNFLNDRERFIVIKYYGLFGQGRLTLNEIGDELGITRSRVGQIFDQIKIKIKGYLLARTKKEVSFFDLVSMGIPLSMTQVHYLELDDDFSSEEIYIIKKLYTGEEEFNRFEILKNLQLPSTLYPEMLDTINHKLMKWKCNINDLDGYVSSLRNRGSK